MTVIERHPPARHRAIFLSDIHLGTRGCQAELLLDFLKRNESETLYLVGDIVDGWRLKRWWYWPQSHNDVVQKIMQGAQGHPRGLHSRQPRRGGAAVLPTDLRRGARPRGGDPLHA